MLNLANLASLSPWPSALFVIIILAVVGCLIGFIPQMPRAIKIMLLVVAGIVLAVWVILILLSLGDRLN